MNILARNFEAIFKLGSCDPNVTHLDILSLIELISIAITTDLSLAIMVSSVR